MKVIKVNSFNGSTSPARINTRLGILYINNEVWDCLQTYQQYFIYLHELGHVFYKDENMADTWALNEYLKLGFTPSQAVKSLTQVLSFTNPEHYQRTSEILRNSAEYDYKYNGNNNALNIIDMYYPNSQTNSSYLQASLADYGYTTEEIDDFLGLGKKAKERREARRAARAERKEAKQERKQSRAESRNAIRLARAEKNLAKADGIRQGTYNPTGGLGESLGGLVSSITGKGGAADEYYDEYDDEAPAQSNSNTGLYIAIAVVVVIIIAVTIVMLKKKKK